MEIARNWLAASIKNKRPLAFDSSSSGEDNLKPTEPQHKIQNYRTPFPPEHKAKDKYEHWPIVDDLKTARNCRNKKWYVTVLTTVLCKENHSPVSMVRSLLYKVIENHLKSRDDDNIIIKDFRKTVINELTKRFNLQFEDTNLISVSHISSFLDPRYKDLEHEPIHVREKIRYHVNNLLSDIFVHQQQPQQHTSFGNSDLKFLYCHESFPENEISDQFQGYLAKTQLRFDFDPFEWWKTREHKYPAIAKLAIKYLTILATLISLERCFSTAEVYEDNSLSRARVFEWCKRFNEGRESTEDDQRPGRPVTVSTPETVTKINQIVCADRQKSIRMISEAVNADKETLVPKNLTPDQKLLRQQVCSDFLERLEEDPGLTKNIITCEETWIFQYDVETKRQSMHWKTPESPRIKKARMSKSKFKAMLIVFFDINGIVMTEWVPEVLEHAPYSPDLAPCDFFLFPKIKSALKGTRFESMEAVKQKTAELLKALIKEDFQHSFDQCWANCNLINDYGYIL
ncbi:hypothetical protein QTP88_021102 [Uroleucon formosanum]